MALACAYSALSHQVQNPDQVIWDLRVVSGAVAIGQKDQPLSVLEFPNGATLTYGNSKLVADYLKLDLVAKKGKAIGNVHITDPDAAVDAQEIDFTWDDSARGGHIDSVHGEFIGLSIEAKSAELSSKKVTLTGVDLGGQGRVKHLYGVRAKSITFLAGKFIKIENPTFRFLGVSLPWNRTITLNQDPRVKGSRLPSVSYSHGALGLNYTPNYLLSPTLAFQGWANIFSGSYPHYGFEVSHTFLDPSIPNQGRIVPGSDLETRFGYGYFDNVIVASPEAEFASERLLRSSVGFDAEANQGSSDRIPGGSITKAGEVVYENSGGLGALAQISHIRLQSVREQGQSSFTTRFVVDTSVGLPVIKLLPDLFSAIRLDGQGFAGDRLYGWARGQFGLAARPFKYFTFSAAYVTASEGGMPDLTTDRLFTNAAWCVRGDAYFGSFRASYLTRYYLNGGMFDDEYELSQVVGNFRVSALYRRFPSDFRIGVTFRLDDMLERLRQHHEPPPGQSQGQ